MLSLPPSACRPTGRRCPTEGGAGVQLASAALIIEGPTTCSTSKASLKEPTDQPKNKTKERPPNLHYALQDKLTSQFQRPETAAVQNSHPGRLRVGRPTELETSAPGARLHIGMTPALTVTSPAARPSRLLRRLPDGETRSPGCVHGSEAGAGRPQCRPGTNCDGLRPSGPAKRRVSHGPEAGAER